MRNEPWLVVFANEFNGLETKRTRRCEKCAWMRMAVNVGALEEASRIFSTLFYSKMYCTKICRYYVVVSYCVSVLHYFFGFI